MWWLLSLATTPQNLTLTAEVPVWHPATFEIEGPMTSETDEWNPFVDARFTLEVEGPTGSWEVPGFYAADGDAAETSADEGSVWQAHFVPPAVGTYEVTGRLELGDRVALAGDGEVFATQSWTLEAEPQMALDPDDWRSLGALSPAGNSGYWLTAGTGQPFLKVGAGSPENFLAYHEFDQTPGTHRFEEHVPDFTHGPTWQGGKGQGILGALEYLADQGMNSVYLILMTHMGDGKDVWPWTSKDERLRFDVSKLAQWDRVFTHAQSLGIHLNLLLSEAENKALFEAESPGEDFPVARRLFYREMVARFGHHNGITWNLGEEHNMPFNENYGPSSAQISDEQRSMFARAIADLDPYGRPITAHNAGWNLFPAMAADPSFSGASMQVGNPANTYERVRWVRELEGGTLAAAIDENGPWQVGSDTDEADPRKDDLRRNILYPAFMAGAFGVEWYFGYETAQDDLNSEDWSLRHELWRQSKIALDFFRDVEVWNLSPNRIDDVPVLESDNRAVAYLAEGGSFEVPWSGTWKVRIFEPYVGRTSRALRASRGNTVIAPTGDDYVLIFDRVID